MVKGVASTERPGADQKRAVIGDRPDLNRAWEEEKPIRLSTMMRPFG